MTITEFLLARIAEDEAVARACAERPIITTWTASRNRREVTPDAVGVAWYIHSGVSSPRDSGTFRQGEAHFERFDPARVLAECQAKRAIIEAAWSDHLEFENEWGIGREREELEERNELPDIVKHLAAVYADHPDYQEEWRP